MPYDYCSHRQPTLSEQPVYYITYLVSLKTSRLRPSPQSTSSEFHLERVSLVRQNTSILELLYFGAKHNLFLATCSEILSEYSTSQHPTLGHQRPCLFPLSCNLDDWTDITNYMLTLPKQTEDNILLC